MNQIVIEGNSVKILEVRKEKVVSLSDFLGKIRETSSIKTGILPRNCLWTETLNDKTVYVVEMHAGLIPIKVVVNSRETTHLVSIPFTQFYFCCNQQSKTINAIMVSVTKTPLASESQLVFVSPYMNIYSSGTGKICTGSMSVRTDVPLHQKINDFVSTFFTSKFNSDLYPSDTIGFASWHCNCKKYVEDWERKTKEDRFFAISSKVTYKEFDTAESIINKVRSV